MTARHPCDPAAGVWVAWFTEPNPRTDELRRVYLRGHGIGGSSSWSLFEPDALRFDSKAEADWWLREACPGRMPRGRRKGSSRIEETS